MLKIDAHQHFWQYDPVRDGWITDDMEVLKKDFLPVDLLPLLQQNNINGCVVVQSAQSKAENIFQLANAAEYDCIKGIVGWVDLQSRRLEEQLEYYSTFKKIKGFREILQGNNDLLLSAALQKGIGLLEKYGFTYDLLVFADQLKEAAEIVKAFPDQKFVLDHLGKPRTKAITITQWKKNIQQLAACPNLYCKISGIVTGEQDDISSYIDVVVEAFGTNRIMFGSDWPVCLTAASYETVVAVTEKYFAAFTKNEQAAFWGLNAQSFYQLN